MRAELHAMAFNMDKMKKEKEERELNERRKMVQKIDKHRKELGDYDEAMAARELANQKKVSQGAITQLKHIKLQGFLKQEEESTNIFWSYKTCYAKFFQKEDGSDDSSAKNYKISAAKNAFFVNILSCYGFPLVMLFLFPVGPGMNLQGETDFSNNPSEARSMFPIARNPGYVILNFLVVFVFSKMYEIAAHSKHSESNNPKFSEPHCARAAHYVPAQVAGCEAFLRAYLVTICRNWVEFVIILALDQFLFVVKMHLVAEWGTRNSLPIRPNMECRKNFKTDSKRHCIFSIFLVFYDYNTENMEK